MRLLLSQSQVSLALSSGIVFFFTLLLFLCGYVLQQKSVRGLQEAVRPRIPQRPQDIFEERAIRLQRSRLFDKDESLRVLQTDFDRDIHTSTAGRQLNWDRLAHVQLLQNHHDVCSAIMVLAELHKQKSPARKVLLIPRAWIDHKETSRKGGDAEDPYLDSTRRLMRLAVRRYRVDLHPIEPIRSHEKEGEVYSLASAYALHGSFDRILVMERPGIILDAEPLDAVLGFTEPAPFVMLHDTVKNDNIHSEDMFLLEPSKKTYQNMTEQLSQPEFAGYSDKFLSTLFPNPVLLNSSTATTALIRSIDTLHHIPKEIEPRFNQTAYLSNVAYIRFSDSKLPGPEYDVPWPDKVKARPENKDADWIWTKLYGEFAEKRMDICGLDLESWRP